MNITELRKTLHNLCQDEGSIAAWADKNGLSFGYVASVIRGDAKPGNKILKVMGLRKSYSLKKNPAVMRFEDITN